MATGTKSREEPFAIVNNSQGRLEIARNSQKLIQKSRTHRIKSRKGIAFRLNLTSVQVFKSAANKTFSQILTPHLKIKNL